MAPLASAASESTPLLRPSSPSPSWLSAIRQGEHEDSAIDIRIRRDISELAGGHESEDEEDFIGRSSFGQALVNSLGDLIGTGLLASPLAIAYCGWVLGPILMLLLGFVTHRTLLVLCKMMLDHPRHPFSYPDIIGVAFDKRFNIRPYLAALFTFECLAWTMALVVLYADTMSAVLPRLSADQYKYLSFFILTPITFLPLHLLSFTSFLGMATSLTLITIIVLNGFTSTVSPGSILHPAASDLWPTFGLARIGVAGGLIMSGYGGHAIMPTIIRDMADKTRWKSVVNISYIIALGVCALVGAAGLLMFGREVSDEITLDLAKIKGPLVFLNIFAAWAVGLNSLTKIPLGMKMLNDLIELNLHIYPKRSPYARSGFPSRANSAPPTPTIKSAALPSVAEETGRSSSSGVAVPGDLEGSQEVDILQAWRKQERRKRFGRFFTKMSSVALIVLLAKLFPSFENVLAFMGSAPAFLVSVILPLLAKKIYLLDNSPEGKEKDAARRHIHWSVEGLGDWVLIWLGVLGAGLGVWGVIVR